ncbi:MAG TPA: Ig-like domain-containing protein, partial [Burkholderiales bacterium]
APVAAPTPPGDMTPPSVFLSRPVAGTSIRRRSSVTVEATASDNVGVVRVEFSVNGRVACRATASPYRCSASIGSNRESSYTVTARAIDAAGHSASHSRTYSAAR